MVHAIRALFRVIIYDRVMCTTLRHEFNFLIISGRIVCTTLRHKLNFIIVIYRFRGKADAKKWASSFVDDSFLERFLRSG